MPKIEITQKMLEQALIACSVDEPTDHDPCQDCYLYNLRDNTGHMSTGRSCFEHLAHDVIDHIRYVNDFEKSQCAKLLQKNTSLERNNANLRAVIESMDPDFFKKRCRVCGCTWDHACPGGCCWVEDDLCSSCAAGE